MNWIKGNASWSKEVILQVQVDVDILKVPKVDQLDRIAPTKKKLLYRLVSLALCVGYASSEMRTGEGMAQNSMPTPMRNRDAINWPKL
jgi:hypothetical protein